MPKRAGKHKITDRDGVISCVLCHKTFVRIDGELVATWDLPWSSDLNGAGEQ